MQPIPRFSLPQHTQTPAAGRLAPGHAATCMPQGTRDQAEAWATEGDGVAG